MIDAGVLQSKLLLDESGFTRGMNKAQREMTNFYERTGKGASNAERHFNSFANSTRRSLDQMTGAARNAQTEMQKLGQIQQTLGGMSGVDVRTAGGLLAGLAFADVLRQSVDYYTKVTGMTKNATEGQYQYYSAIEDVRKISNETQSDLQSVTMFYARVNNSIKEYGLGMKEAEMITSTVSNALKAMGASTYEASSAMLQLSQGMQSGKLGGEEFRAAMESAPILMKQLAQSMGVEFKDLKKLAEEGALTIDVLVKAWTDPKFLQEVQEKAKNMHTITGALTMMRNELQMTLGEMMNSSGGTGATVGAINAMTDSIKFLMSNIDSVVAAFTIWIGVKGGQFIASSIASVNATLKEIDVTRAHIAAIAIDNQKNLESAQAKAKLAMATQGLVAANIRHQAQMQTMLAAQIAELNAIIASDKAKIAAAGSSAMLASTKQRLAANEAALAAVTDKYNASVAESVALTKANAIASNEASMAKLREAAATKALDAANKDMLDNTATGFAGAKSKIGAIVGNAGLIGMGLWMAYEIADYAGITDKIFANAESRAAEAAKKISGEIKKLDIEQQKTLLNARKSQYEDAYSEYAIRHNIRDPKTEKERAMLAEKGMYGMFERAEADRQLAKYRTEIKAIEDSIAMLEAKVASTKYTGPSDDFTKGGLTKAEEYRKKVLDAEGQFNKEYQRLMADTSMKEADRIKHINRLYEVHANKIAGFQEKTGNAGKAGGSKASKEKDLSVDPALVFWQQVDEKMADKELVLGEKYIEAQSNAQDAAYKEMQDRSDRQAKVLRDAFKDDYSAGIMTDMQQTWQDYLDVWGGNVEAAGEAFVRVYGEKIEEAKEISKTFGDELADALQKPLANWLTDFKGGLGGLEDAFKETLKRMAAEWAAAKIMETSGFGGESSKNSSSKADAGGAMNFLKQAANWIGLATGIGGGTQSPAPVTDLSTQAQFNFAGGGTTPNIPRVGGVDGRGGFFAVMHGNETVIDHTKGQAGGQVINVTNNFTFSQPQSRDTQDRIAERVAVGISRAQRNM